jgi:hypothetical protein
MPIDQPGGLMTPRRQRDLARQSAPDPMAAPMTEPDTDDAGGPALTCPNCGTSLSLKAVASGPATPQAPPMPDTGGGAPPFGQ